MPPLKVSSSPSSVSLAKEPACRCRESWTESVFNRRATNLVDVAAAKETASRCREGWKESVPKRARSVPSCFLSCSCCCCYAWETSPAQGDASSVTSPSVLSRPSSMTLHRVWGKTCETVGEDCVTACHVADIVDWYRRHRRAGMERKRKGPQRRPLGGRHRRPGLRSSVGRKLYPAQGARDKRRKSCSKKFCEHFVSRVWCSNFLIYETIHFLMLKKWMTHVKENKKKILIRKIIITKVLLLK